VDSPLDQHDWWDNANVSGLIDLEAFHRFLYDCNHLLESTSSNDNDYDVVSREASHELRRLQGEQPKIGQCPKTPHQIIKETTT
jgi:hypothetical protein